VLSFKKSIEFSKCKNAPKYDPSFSMLEISFHYDQCEKLKKALKYAEMAIFTLDSL
jgi:hypothetical protein